MKQSQIQQHKQQENKIEEPATTAEAQSNQPMSSRVPDLSEEKLSKDVTKNGDEGENSTQNNKTIENAGVSYEKTRKVSFPVHDNELVTGYLEPANPWASIKSVEGVNELADLYRESCTKHQTRPNDMLMQHLSSIHLKDGERVPILNLKEQFLSSEDCEAIEEILKRVQYRVIDVSSCGLDDVSSSALFDMIEYYEATNELNISDNKNITNRGWQACISMVKKSQALQILCVRGIPLTDQNATQLGKAMMSSSLHTLKLEHCGLTGRPLSSLCTALKRNTVLKELWLAHNDLTQHDAYNIGLLLKSNFYIQFLDVSNNYIADLGVSYIVDALIEQASKLSEINNQIAATPISSAPATTKATTTITTPTTKYNTLSTNPVTPSTQTSNKFVQEIVASNEVIKDDDVFEKMDVDVGKGGGRSKLDVLLTQCESTPTPVNSLDIMKSDLQSDIILNKTNVDLLNTIYENQTLMTTPSETAALPTTTTTTTIIDPFSIKGNDDVVPASVQQETSEKLDSVSEETEAHLNELEEQERFTTINDTNNITNNEPNELFKKCKETHNSQIKVQDSIPNRINENYGDRNENENSNTNDNSNVDSKNSNKVFAEHETDILVQDNKEDIVELKMIEDEEKRFEACDNNNPFEIIQSDENKILNKTTTKTEQPSENMSNHDSSKDINKNIEKPPMLNIIYDPAKRCDINMSSDSDRDEFLKQSNDSDMLDKSTESFEFIDPISPLPSQQLSKMIIAPTITEKQLSASFDDSILLKFSTPPPPPLADPASKDPKVSAATITTTTADNNKPSEFPICDLKTIHTISVTTDDVELIKVLPDLPPPERSFSSDSINSDTSIDSNDSKSSIRLTESKFAKNGTLERQPDKNVMSHENAVIQPTGLQVLVLWNNQISRHSSKSFSELLAKTNSLDILNIGHNVLNNDFVANIKTSLKSNTTVTNLGLQSAHLSCAGIKHLSEIIEFGGNSTLQRIDLRDNNIDVVGLTALEEALKNNKTVTQIDLDEPQSKILESNGNSATTDFSRLVTNIRAQCARNENPPPEAELLVRTNVMKARSAFKTSRKISLTCQSIRPTNTELNDRNLLDPNSKLAPPQSSAHSTIKSIGRLRSPLPSPNPSPMSSPIPSPSRSRFQVSKVLENISISPSPSMLSTSSSTNSSPSGSIGSSRFRVTAVRDTTLLKKENKSSSNFTPIAPVDKPVTTKSSSHNYHNEIINFTFNFDDTPVLNRTNVMDDSCSSLSSMDSIDRPINTSSSNDDSSSLDNLIISPKAFSSLMSESLSSQESFTENKLLSHLKAEDDDTLTNTPMSHNQSSPISVTNVDSCNQSKQNLVPRVRKASFLSGSLSKGSSVGNIMQPSEVIETPYSHGIEKLLSIFRSTSLTLTESNKKNSREELVSTTAKIDANPSTTSSISTTTSVTATRKDSPMSNLFALFKHTTNKTVPPEEVTIQPQIKSNSCSQIVQHKLSDNNLSDCINLPSSSQHNIPTQAAHFDNATIPSKVHEEKFMREEHQPPPSLSSTTQQPCDRVHFEVGGDDDDDDDDDDEEEDEDDNSTVDTLSISMVTPTTTTTTTSLTPALQHNCESLKPSSNESQNELSLNSKLGQIARDSLQIIHGGGSNDSQDSMISFELDTIPSSPPNTEPDIPCNTLPYHQINIQPFPKDNF